MRRRGVLFICCIVAAVLLRGETVADAQQLPPPTWSDCGGGFECSTLRVPLDYAQPAGRQIDLALIRQPAREPAQRIGSLLVDPGGPGASGVDFVRGWARVLPTEISDRFDIVGFDPRGVGDSTPLICHDGLQQLAGLDPAPPTVAGWRALEQANRDFVEACAAVGGEMLAHLGSRDVVRDMDRIRVALREDRITYLGYSYGTVLGALYAEAFPQRVRALVLDGPVDTSLSPDALMATQAAGFEQALARFVADCRANGCVLAQGGGDPAALIDRLFAETRAHPLPAPEADRPAGPGEAWLAVVQALYGRGGWPGLARAVQQGLDGDGSAIVHLADRYLGRTGSGYDNLTEMNNAVNCVDYAFPRDPSYYKALAARLALQSPHFGAAAASEGLPCAYWPVPASPIGALHAPGAPPVLVIGTTHDPATPYPWALAVWRALASAVLLTHEGDGHTVYASGNRCVDEVVDAYLITLAVPQDGSICGTGDAPLAPPAVATASTPAATASSTPAAAGVPPARGGAAIPTPAIVGFAALALLLAVSLAVLRSVNRRRRR